MPSFRPAALAALLLLLACSPLDRDRDAEPARAPVVDDADARCAALEGATAERMRITQVQWIPAGRLRARDPQSGDEVGEPLPALAIVTFLVLLPLLTELHQLAVPRLVVTLPPF